MSSNNREYLANELQREETELELLTDWLEVKGNSVESYIELKRAHINYVTLRLKKEG
jgi:hypothetical protein